MSSDPLLVLENALTRCAPSVMESATAGMVRAGLQRIDQGFARGVDIHGQRYQLPQDGHRPPMVRSGALRDSYLARVQRGGRTNQITFYNVRPYDEYLRDGTPKMKPRQHIPRPGERPPPDMDAAFERATGSAMANYWSGVRL